MGEWLDHEHVADLLGLTCTKVPDSTVIIDGSVFAPHLDAIARRSRKKSNLMKLPSKFKADTSVRPDNPDWTHDAFPAALKAGKS